MYVSGQGMKGCLLPWNRPFSVPWSQNSIICVFRQSQEHLFFPFVHLLCIFGLAWLKISSILLIYSQFRIEWSWQRTHTRKHGYTETADDSEPRWLERQCRRGKGKSVWLGLTIWVWGDGKMLRVQAGNPKQVSRYIISRNSSWKYDTEEFPKEKTNEDESDSKDTPSSISTLIYCLFWFSGFSPMNTLIFPMLHSFCNIKNPVPQTFYVTVVIDDMPVK